MSGGECFVVGSFGMLQTFDGMEGKAGFKPRKEGIGFEPFERMGEQDGVFADGQHLGGIAHAASEADCPFTKCGDIVVAQLFMQAFGIRTALDFDGERVPFAGRVGEVEKRIR